MKADPDVIAVTAKPFPEPELYVLAVDLANIALSGRNGGKTAYEDVYKELAKRVGPALTAIDSILAEAGDERAPVRVMGNEALRELMADWKSGPHTEKLREIWNASGENSEIAGMQLDERLNCADSLSEFLAVTLSQRTIQGWIDRLRGIRAALKETK